MLNICGRKVKIVTGRGESHTVRILKWGGVDGEFDWIIRVPAAYNVTTQLQNHYFKSIQEVAPYLIEHCEGIIEQEP